MPEQRKYTIVLHPDPDEGGYWVTVPALPGCYSQGDTRDEAIAYAREAIQLYLEDLVDNGEPIPEERERPETLVIEVAA